MNIVSKIKNVFSKTKETEMAADVTFYSNKIIVQTFDFTDGPSIGSTKLTILPPDCSSSTLGQTLRKHFALTEHDLKYSTKNNNWVEYKKAAGFKTNKETYKDAKNVSCRQTQTHIILTPTQNLYNTGYEHIPKLDISTPLSVSDHDLGLFLLEVYKRSVG